MCTTYGLAYVLDFYPSQKLEKGTKLKLMDTLIQHDHCTPRTVQGSKNIIENFVYVLTLP